jgi:hypothetical protein
MFTLVKNTARNYPVITWAGVGVSCWVMKAMNTSYLATTMYAGQQEARVKEIQKLVQQ